MKTEANEAMKDYYKILGVEKNATQKQIRKMAYQKGKVLHPKKSKSTDHNVDAFIEVIEAYTVLNSEKNREVYDWLYDHERGTNLLREEALNSHYKTIENASKNGVGIGHNYAKSSFWEFRDDLKSSQWWNWVDLLPWP